MKRSAPDGRQARCSDCVRAYRRAYYAENKPKVVAARARYYQAHKQEMNAKSVAVQRTPASRAKRAARYAANAESHRAAAKIARDADRERYRARQRAYYRRHPEKFAAANQMRDARMRNACVQDVTPGMLAERASVFGNRCAYCRGPHEHWDHVIPIARGGKHCLANLRPACRTCNLSKNDSPHLEWLAKVKARDHGHRARDH